MNRASKHLRDGRGADHVINQQLKQQQSQRSTSKLSMCRDQLHNTDAKTSDNEDIK